MVQLDHLLISGLRSEVQQAMTSWVTERDSDVPPRETIGQSRAARRPVMLASSNARSELAGHMSALPYRRCWKNTADDLVIPLDVET